MAFGTKTQASEATALASKTKAMRNSIINIEKLCVPGKEKELENIRSNLAKESDEVSKLQNSLIGKNLEISKM